MKYYEVAFETDVCYSCNIIKGETETACRYAAEQHAKRYGYKVATFSEIEESALEYNRKPVWSADRYPEPAEPEQPETAEADETEANEQEENTMEIRHNEYADMPYIEFRKKFHRTLKTYPGMECAYNPHYAYEVTTTKYYKVGTKWHEKAEEKTVETVPGHYYMNMIDAIPFFRNLGGSERVAMGYTLAGYIPVQLSSISPDGKEKILRKFKPVQI